MNNMTKTILQKVVFKNTTAKALYEMYMDAKKHSIATGGPVKITAKEGDKYMVYDGYVTGKNLQLIKNKLIVQTWRASDWTKEDMDSTLVLAFGEAGNDAYVYMTHANVPERQYDSIKKGWDTYYWKPWKKILGK